jgi:hypothetical protein
MEQITSWEANSRSARNNFPALWNPKFHYLVQKFATEPDKTQSTTFYPVSLRFTPIFFHLRLGIPNDLFPSDFPTKVFYAFLISSMNATRLAYHILPDLISPVIFDEA